MISKMSKLQKTLDQVDKAHKSIKSLNRETDLLPESMRAKLKEMEKSLFAQSCQLHDLIEEETRKNPKKQKVNLPIWMKMLSKDTDWDKIPKKEQSEIIDRLVVILKEEKESIFIHLNGEPVKISLNEKDEVVIDPVDAKYVF